MWSSIPLLVCMACASHGRRMQMSSERLLSSPLVELLASDAATSAHVNPITALSALLLASKPSSAFSPSISGVKLRSANPSHSASALERQSRHHAEALMSDATGAETLTAPDRYRPDDFKVGDSIKCRIMRVNHEQNVITLKTDDRTPTKELKLGARVEGKIQRIIRKDGKELTYVFVDIGARSNAVLPATLYGPLDNLKVNDPFSGIIHEIGHEKLVVKPVYPDERTPADEFNIGDEVVGTVKSIDASKMSALVDIGAQTNAFLYVSKPFASTLEIGDTVKGYVLTSNPENQHIALIRTPPEKLKLGEEVEGTIVEKHPSFSFVDIGASSNAALNQKYLSGPQSLHDNFEVGDRIKCRIQSLDDKTISLSYGDGTPIYELILGQEVTATFRRIEQEFGIMDIGATTSAMLHVSQLYENKKRPNEPSDLRQYFQVGDKIKADILVVDLDDGDVQLSCHEFSERNIATNVYSALRGWYPHKMKVGHKYKGIVKNVTSRGVHVDIGTRMNGLWPAGKLDKPLDQFRIRDRIDVRIESIEEGVRALESGRQVKDFNLLLNRASGTPVEEFKKGDLVEGNVRSVNKAVGFVDIGASNNALLFKEDFSTESLPRLSEKLEVGDTVKCRIKDVNLDVMPPDISLTCLNRGQDFKEGDKVEGTIKYFVSSLAFVDIGMSTEALLPTRGEELAVGDTVKTFVSHVDTQKEEIVLAFSDERDIDDSDMGGQVAGKEEREESDSRAAPDDDRIPLHELKVGEEVTGTITGITDKVARIDIGAVREALLLPSQFNNETDRFDLESNDMLQVGSTLKCRIRSVSLDRKKVLVAGLNPGRGLMKNNFLYGEEVMGTVKNVYSEGFWVDIGHTKNAALPVFSE